MGKIIHRTKLPQGKPGESKIITDLKLAEQEALDTPGPLSDAVKNVMLGEKIPETSKLWQPRPHREIEIPGVTRPYKRGDIIEYPDGRCKWHVVVSNGPIMGVKKIPCYTIEMARRVQEKLNGKMVDPMTNPKDLVERPRR